MKSEKIFGAILCLTLILYGCKRTEEMDIYGKPKISTETMNSEYSAICLESKSNDTEAFGRSIAASNNYFAVADTKANRITIYSRNGNNIWQRIKEIYPPPNSFAKELGYGFGSNLALKNGILIIKSIGNKRTLKDKSIQYLAELYAVSLDSPEAELIPKKINYPDLEKTSISSISFVEDKIVFAARTIDEKNHRINRIYIADATNGKVINYVQSSKMQYADRDLDAHNTYRIALDDYKNSIVFGDLHSYWHKSLFSSRLDGEINEIIFDPKKVEKETTVSALSNYDLLEFAITDELTAIGRNQFGGQNTLIFKGFPEISEFKIVNLSGVLDAHKSHVLISHRTPPGMMPTYQKDVPDHTLVGLRNSEIAVESKIIWERDQSNYPYSESLFINAVGAISERGLFLAAKGKTIYLPFTNLPKRYEIKLSICGEQ